MTIFAVPAENKKQTRNRYPQWDEQIIALYVEERWSLRRIAEEICWSPNFVRNRLLFNGIELRKRGGKVTRRTHGAAILATVNMYQRGMSSDEIAEEHGVSRSTVLRRLEKAGVKRRSPGAPSHKHRPKTSRTQ